METAKDKKGLIQVKEHNVLRIPIVFTPRECLRYEESVVFDINGLQQVQLRFTGEGVPLKLEFERNEDQNVDFGVFSVGQTGTRSVVLINQSPKAINLSFVIGDQLKDLKEKCFLKVRPKREFLVNPRERKEIVLIFRPS